MRLIQRSALLYAADEKLEAVTNKPLVALKRPRLPKRSRRPRSQLRCLLHNVWYVRKYNPRVGDLGSRNAKSFWLDLIFCAYSGWSAVFWVNPPCEKPETPIWRMCSNNTRRSRAKFRRRLLLFEFYLRSRLRPEGLAVSRSVVISLQTYVVSIQEDEQYHC